MSRPTDVARDDLVVLEDRARVLARPRDSHHVESGAETVLEFQAGEECFGIGIDWVRETGRIGRWTRVPGSADFVLGVVSVRGQVLSLLDLPTLLGLGPSGTSDRGFLVRLGNGDMELCVGADSVLGMRRVRTDELQDPGRLLAETGSALIRGVTADRLFLLDGGGILDHAAPGSVDAGHQDGQSS